MLIFIIDSLEFIFAMMWDFLGLCYTLFVLEPAAFLSTIYVSDLIKFFLPALLIDMPRYIMSDLLVLIREWFFTKDRDSTEFAQRLKSDNPPSVSVLLPGYNEAETVGKTIVSFLESGYPNMEIIIVSDGSIDGMDHICRKYADRENIHFYTHYDRCGKSAAANYAFRMSRGEFLLIADADTTFDRDAVYQILLPFADPKVGGVSGNLRVRNWSQNLITRFQALEYLFSISIGRRFSDMFNILAIISGAFGAFRRKAIEEIGGWDIGPGEDADITIKLRKAGHSIRFAPKAMCQTNVPDSWKRYWKQRLRWNRSLIRFRWRKHKNIYTNWWRFDLGTVIGMADSFFFQAVMPFVRVPYVIMVAFFFLEKSHVIIAGTLYFYTLANIFQFIIMMFLTERPRQDIKLWWAVPFLTFFRLYETLDRLYACIDELIFETSFTDPYVPSRVLKQSDRKWDYD